MTTVELSGTWAGWSHLARFRVYLAMLACYVALTALADLSGLVPGVFRTVWFIPSYVVMPFVGGWLVLATWTLHRLRVREHGAKVHGWRGWRLGWRQARATHLPDDRLWSLAIVCLTTPVLLNTFGSWKAAIPDLRPFAWDATFIAWDRAIHGTDPWRLLPMWPWFTRAIDRLYRLWLPMVPAVVVWIAWQRDDRLRQRFLVTFLLAWVLLGNVLATVFSSAGPCFLAAVTGSHGPYRDLWPYLDHFTPSLSARTLHAVLWQAYLAQDANPFTRISAMPSMHVALPVLYTLTAWHISRRLAFAFALYGLVILIGSVHLGWHYAVDGYVSIAAVLVLWCVVGRVLRAVSR